MSFLWILDPCVSVGPFRFGEPIQAIVEEYGLCFLRDDGRDDWDTYVFSDCESRLYAENGRLTGVGCFDELIYEGTNLFGLSLQELRATFGPEDEIGEEIGGETPVEFERFGIQVWLRDDLVRSVMCNPCVADE